MGDVSSSIMYTRSRSTTIAPWPSARSSAASTPATVLLPLAMGPLITSSRGALTGSSYLRKQVRGREPKHGCDRVLAASSRARVHRQILSKRHRNTMLHEAPQRVFVVGGSAAEHDVAR